MIDPLKFTIINPSSFVQELRFSLRLIYPICDLRNATILKDIESILSSGLNEPSSINLIFSFSNAIPSADSTGSSDFFWSNFWLVENTINNIRRISAIDRPSESLSTLTIDSIALFADSRTVRDSLCYLFEFESSSIPQIDRNVKMIDPLKFTIINPSSFVQELRFSLRLIYPICDLRNATILKDIESILSSGLNEPSSLNLIFSFSDIPSIDCTESSELFLSELLFIEHILGHVRRISAIDRPFESLSTLTIDSIAPFADSQTLRDSFASLSNIECFSIPSIDRYIGRIDLFPLDAFHFRDFSALPIEPLSLLPSDSNDPSSPALRPPHTSALINASPQSILAPLTRFSAIACPRLPLLPNSSIDLPPFSGFPNLTLSFLHDFTCISRPSRHFLPSTLAIHVPLVPSDTFGSRPFSFISLRSIEPRSDPPPTSGLRFISIAPPSFDITDRLSHIRDLHPTDISHSQIPDFDFDSTTFLNDEPEPISTFGENAFNLLKR
jgi:hypothetical protein